MSLTPLFLGGDVLEVKTRRASTWRRYLQPNMLAAYIAILLGGLVSLAPFYFMLVYSTQTETAIFSAQPPLVPGEYFLENARNLFENVPFIRNLWNSFYIAVLATLVTVLFSGLAGFAFAMYDFRGRETLFTAVLATLLLPAFLNLVPFFLMMQAFNWIDKPIALWLPAAANAFGVFLLRQYIGSTLSRDLLEAGRIDGCSEFGLFWRLALPLIKPALGTLALITFVGSWNNFATALVILQSRETNTVQLALRGLQGAYDTDWGALLAGTALTVTPLIIIFIFTSKQMIEGLMAGSVKG